MGLTWEAQELGLWVPAGVGGGEPASCKLAGVALSHGSGEAGQSAGLHHCTEPARGAGWLPRGPRRRVSAPSVELERCSCSLYFVCLRLAQCECDRAKSPKICRISLPFRKINQNFLPKITAFY